MITFNRRDVTKTGSSVLSVSSPFRNRRTLGLIFTATILSLAGTFHAQAMPQEWPDEKGATELAGSIGMPAVGTQTTQSTMPASGCTQGSALGCVSNDLDSAIEVYIFNLPLKHGGPR